MNMNKLLSYDILAIHNKIKIVVWVFFCIHFINLLVAQLLREGDNDRVAEEDSDLLQAEHRDQRRNHVRLQVPDRGREDSLLMRGGYVQGHSELNPLFLAHQERGIIGT